MPCIATRQLNAMCKDVPQPQASSVLALKGHTHMHAYVNLELMYPSYENMPDIDAAFTSFACGTQAMSSVLLTRVSAVQMVSMAHVFHVWWLHGLTYKPMDAVLFLDIRSLVFSIHGKIRWVSSIMLTT